MPDLLQAVEPFQRFDHVVGFGRTSSANLAGAPVSGDATPGANRPNSAGFLPFALPLSTLALPSVNHVSLCGMTHGLLHPSSVKQANY